MHLRPWLTSLRTGCLPWDEKSSHAPFDGEIKISLSLFPGRTCPQADGAAPLRLQTMSFTLLSVESAASSSPHQKTEESATRFLRYFIGGSAASKRRRRELKKKKRERGRGNSSGSFSYQSRVRLSRSAWRTSLLTFHALSFFFLVFAFSSIKGGFSFHRTVHELQSRAHPLFYHRSLNTIRAFLGRFRTLHDALQVAAAADIE